MRSSRSPCARGLAELAAAGASLEEEDAVLQQDPSVDPLSLERALGRSDGAVRRRLAALGLRRDRERSPHHPVPVSKGLSPGELRLLAREIAAGDGRRFLSLSRRLGRPPGALKRTATTLQTGDQGEAETWIAFRAQPPVGSKQRAVELGVTNILIPRSPPQ